MLNIHRAESELKKAKVNERWVQVSIIIKRRIFHATAGKEPTRKGAQGSLARLVHT